MNKCGCLLNTFGINNIKKKKKNGGCMVIFKKLSDIFYN